MKSYAIKFAIDTIIDTRFILTIGPTLIALFSNAQSLELIPNPLNHQNEEESGYRVSQYEYNGELFFRYRNNDNLFQLWKYDGSALTLIPNPPDHGDDFRGYVGTPCDYNGEVFLLNINDNRLYQLYKYDGMDLTLILNQLITIILIEEILGSQ